MEWDMGRNMAQMVEAYPFVNPLPNPYLTNAETGAVGNSFFIGKTLIDFVYEAALCM